MIKIEFDKTWKNDNQAFNASPIGIYFSYNKATSKFEILVMCIAAIGISFYCKKRK